MSAALSLSPFLFLSLFSLSFYLLLNVLDVDSCGGNAFSKDVVCEREWLRMMHILIGHVTALIARVLQCMCPCISPLITPASSLPCLPGTFCFHCDLRAFKYISLRLLPTVICIMQMRLGTRSSQRRQCSSRTQCPLSAYGWLHCEK